MVDAQGLWNDYNMVLFFKGEHIKTVSVSDVKSNFPISTSKFQKETETNGGILGWGIES